MTSTYSDFGGSNIMPLLMGFTPTTPIEEAELTQFYYNETEQISYSMLIGTRSLKISWTQVSSNKYATRKSDQKNEIDDRK